MNNRLTQACDSCFLHGPETPSPDPRFEDYSSGGEAPRGPISNPASTLVLTARFVQLTIDYLSPCLASYLVSPAVGNFCNY